MLKKIIYPLYLWLIAMPLLLIITIIVALSTIVLSPLLPNSPISYMPARFWARSFCWLTFVRVRVHGLHNLDSTVSSVFALNHQSIYDVFVVYGWFPQIFKWIMKAELRKIPLIGKACQEAGHIFIDRSSPMAAKHSLDNAEKVLKNGVSLMIFPEGTRTKTGKMMPFKKGAFRIAADLNLPVIPVTIKGSFDRMRRDSIVIRPGTIDVLIHDPIEVEAFLPDRVHELIQQTFDTIQSGLK